MCCFVDKEYAIEVIDLMLKDLRKEAAAAHDKLVPVCVVCAYSCACRSLHEAVFPADREAAFGELFLFLADADKLRVDKYRVLREEFGCALRDDKDAQTMTNLRCCDCDTICLGRKRGFHISDHLFDTSTFDVSNRYWRCNCAQYRGRFLNDVFHTI